MVVEKYERTFTDIFKEAKSLSSLEVREKLSESEWKNKCQKLFGKGKQAREDIDEDVEKLNETKHLFWRVDPGHTRCDMLAHYIEEDCERKPEKCPIGVKKLIVSELKEDLANERRMLEWGKRENRKSTIELYEKSIKKTEEQIRKLEE